MKRLLFAVVLFVFTPCYTNGNPDFKTEHTTDGCVCEKFGCSCCLYIDVPQIWLNDTACINFAYDPDIYGISFVLSIDDKALINETISARDPPPICFPVPVIEDFVDMCVHFTDLSISNQDFHGCVALEIRMWWVYVVAELKLGCFDTDPSTKCKKHIDKVIIHKVPEFHNMTVNDKHKYNLTVDHKHKFNLVPMLDMMPVNEVKNTTDSLMEDGSFHLLNVTTVSPKEDGDFDLLNVTTVSPKKDVSISLLNATTVTPNRNQSVNGAFTKQVISKVNHSMISDDLPFCAAISNLGFSLPYLLVLVALQMTVAVNLMKSF